MKREEKNQTKIMITPTDLNFQKQNNYTYILHTRTIAYC